MAMTTFINSSTENPVLLQNIRNHLARVLHAHKCLQGERQPTNTNNNHQTSSQNMCTVPQCATMRNVLLHMTTCNDLQNCSFPDCLQSRYAILHWRNCTIPNCFICGSSQNVTITRNRLVEEILMALLNIIRVNYQSLTSDEIGAIRKLAEKIESNAFHNAISADDYAKRAMNHINTIREAHAKKKLLKKQQILTTTSAPSDEQDSSNGIVPPSDATDIHMEKISEDHSTSATTTEINKKERNDLELGKTDDSAPINTINEPLPKHPAVFSPDDIRNKMRPVLSELNEHQLGGWFRQPVTEAIAPGYFDIIKHPMDFSTIFKKFDENQYTTPFQFWEDMWLVFNNTWTFNKKTQRVYKAGVKLADLFTELVNPIMKDYYGYCCGRQYVFLPPAMFCYGVGGICCTIPRDGDYFVYNNPDTSRNNLSSDKYTFCKKCFDSVKSDYMLVGDDPAQTLVKLLKEEFRRAKNDHQEQEAMVDCIVCSRRFHNICVLYHEHIWPEGYVCKQCVNQYNIKRKDNRYLARKLTMTDLANRLEERANDFLKNQCGSGAGRVTIRVLAASDRVCEVKPRFKKHFGAQIPDGYPYRSKAIFAFQEIEGVDVVLFGMHVQEYDSRCPGPNSKRVYISYLDSVHYFRPEDQRTALYYELLIGYLEYVKQLGFTYAHIWACPPKKGDDYIFYCHPVEQRVPGPERLQKWYEDMLYAAKLKGVVVDYKYIKAYADSNITSAMDIPYFEDDFWPKIIEDSLEKFETVNTSDSVNLDDSIEPEKPTKSYDDPTHKKKKFKTTTSEYQVAEFLVKEIKLKMQKQGKSFFVVQLHDSMSNSATIIDPDPLIQCDLMESRDAFLSFAHNNNCEFSTLRRAKYSTMFLLMELQSSRADKISYICNICRQQCDLRYHCNECKDFDLCVKCYTTIKHEHRMERSDEVNERTANSDTLIDTIRHALQCQNTNCTFDNCGPCKWLIEHMKRCRKVPRKQCPCCKGFLTCIWTHAKICTDQNCPLPYCAGLKSKIQQQRVRAMDQAQIASGSLPLASQSSATTPSRSFISSNKCDSCHE